MSLEDAAPRGTDPCDRAGGFFRAAFIATVLGVRTRIAMSRQDLGLDHYIYIARQYDLT